LPLSGGSASYRKFDSLYGAPFRTLQAFDAIIERRRAFWIVKIDPFWTGFLAHLAVDAFGGEAALRFDHRAEESVEIADQAEQRPQWAN
jgi:hypothetical protein